MEIHLPSNLSIANLLDIISKGNITKAREQLPVELLEFILKSFNGTNIENLTFIDQTLRIKNPASARDSEEHYDYRKSLIRAYGLITMIASLIGMLGNGLVITVYLKKLKDLSVVKLLILHLAVADFVFSVSQSVLAVPSIQVTGWEYGEPACKFIQSFVTLGSLIAVGTMLVIAIERYYSIVRALQYTNQKRRVVVLVVIVWAASISSVTPSTVALKLNRNTRACEENWVESGFSKQGEVFYEFFLLIVWFLIPMGIISFCYISIIKLLKQPLEKRGLSAWNVSPRYFTKRKKEDMKAVRTSVVVVFAFFFCCFPIRLMWVILKFIDVGTMSAKSFFALVYTGHLPYPLHVAANPLIYSLIDKNFRKDVKNLIRVKTLRANDRLLGSSLREANAHRLSVTWKSFWHTSLEMSPEI